MTNSENQSEQVTLTGLSINKDLTKGPYFVDGCDTLSKLFRARCQELGKKTAHREKTLGIWLSYDWATFYDNARLIGLGDYVRRLRDAVMSGDPRWVHRRQAGHHRPLPRM